MAKNLRTARGRVSFPCLSEPEGYKGSLENRKYSVTLIFPNRAAVEPLFAAAKELIESKVSSEVKRNKIEIPIHPGSKKLKDDGTYPDGYTEECFFVKFHRGEKNGPPQIVLEDPKKTGLARDLYAGCIARVATNPYLWGDNAGLSFSLNAVQRVGEGEAFGAGPVDTEAIFEDESAAEFAELLEE